MVFPITDPIIGATLVQLDKHCLSIINVEKVKNFPLESDVVIHENLLCEKLVRNNYVLYTCSFPLS